MLGPVLAGTLRLVIVAGAGWWLTTWPAPVWTVFALVGLAMAAFGLATAAAIYFVSWEHGRGKAAKVEKTGNIAV